MKTRIVVAMSLLTGLYTAISTAGTISQVPLFLAAQVNSNIFWEIDDSGSMDWTILSKQYWHPRTYDPDSGDDNNVSADSTATGTTSMITDGNMYSFGLN